MTPPRTRTAPRIVVLPIEGSIEGPIGERRGWDLVHVPTDDGDDAPPFGHRVDDAGLHLAEVERDGAVIRRRLDVGGVELDHRRWPPLPSRRPADAVAPIGAAATVVIERDLGTPRAWLGRPASSSGEPGDWSELPLPEQARSVAAIVPSPCGGALVSGSVGPAASFVVAVSTDGSAGAPTIAGGENPLTARHATDAATVSVHAFDNPWEPSLDVVVRPRRGLARRFGKLGLEVAGLLWFDGWLVVIPFGSDRRYAVPVGRSGLGHRALFGGVLRVFPFTLARTAFGLDLVPGRRRLLGRLDAALGGPYERFRLLPGEEGLSVQRPRMQPRTLRWTRLADATTGTWTFEGPARPDGARPVELVLART